MANNKSDYLETALINAVLRGQTYTSPSAVYVALFTTIPNEDGTGGVEVSGGSYARQAVTFGVPTQVSGAATTSNSALVTFPSATASWGTVTAMGIYDNTSGGNLLYFGAVATSKTIGSGDQVTLPIASLVVSET